MRPDRDDGANVTWEVRLKPLQGACTDVACVQLVVVQCLVLHCSCIHPEQCLGTHRAQQVVSTVAAALNAPQKQSKMQLLAGR